MFEKVNPKHPDKLADRIAGALVDRAYAKEEDPRISEQESHIIDWENGFVCKYEMRDRKVRQIS